MKLPGFTANASLYKTFKHYSGTGGLTSFGTPLIAPQGVGCSICHAGVKALLNTLVSTGCPALGTELGSVCAGASLFVPILGEGPGEAACTALGVALNAICQQFGEQWVKDNADQAASMICANIGLC
jgi:hypothetical protein